jgi:hypothetical protein
MGSCKAFDFRARNQHLTQITCNVAEHSISKLDDHSSLKLSAMYSCSQFCHGINNFLKKMGLCVLLPLILMCTEKKTLDIKLVDKNITTGSCEAACVGVKRKLNMHINLFRIF